MRFAFGPHLLRFGRETRFTRRESKLDAVTFLQGLTSGWLLNPNATLNELAGTIAAHGASVTPQGVHARFTRESTLLALQALQSAVTRAVKAEENLSGLLARFPSVLLLDSSIINLPSELASLWRGTGNGWSARNAENVSALKASVILDLVTGELRGPTISEGRVHDRATTLQGFTPEVGSLRVTDLGYFTLSRFQELSDEGCFFLSRLRAGVRVLDENNRRLHLPSFLEGEEGVDANVTLGEQRLSCRLLAVRVPDAVSEARRAALRREGTRRKQGVSGERHSLTRWTILVTNAPSELLSVSDALALYGARWQVEVLFRLWKKTNCVAGRRSGRPYRVATETLVKLLGVLVQHWLLVASCWGVRARSLERAAGVLRSHVLSISRNLWRDERLLEELLALRVSLQHCRTDARRARPSTHQKLNEKQT